MLNLISYLEMYKKMKDVISDEEVSFMNDNCKLMLCSMFSVL